MEEDNSICHSTICHLSFVSRWPRLIRQRAETCLWSNKKFEKDMKSALLDCKRIPWRKKKSFTFSLRFSDFVLSSLTWSMFQWKSCASCERQDGFRLKFLFLLYIHQGICTRTFLSFWSRKLVREVAMEGRQRKAQRHLFCPQASVPAAQRCSANLVTATMPLCVPGWCPSPFPHKHLSAGENQPATSFVLWKSSTLSQYS